MTAVFISDLHLDDSRPAATRYFLKLLDELKLNKIDKLYILGDFLEYWVGDDDPSSCAKECFEALKNAADVFDVYFMHGNRDFLISETFAKKYKISLIPDPTIININRKKILLMHGDTLCIDDKKYQEFRKLVRSPVWQSQMLKKPLSERLQIATKLRNESQIEIDLKDEFIMDVNKEEVDNVFDRYDVDELIHGHTHRPNIHKIKMKDKYVRRIVLGDWYKSSYVLFYDSKGILIDRHHLPNQ